MFECKECANRGSVLCELCTTITHPDGEESKPNYYIEFNSVVPFDAKRDLQGRGENIAVALEIYLRAGWALPVSMVMEYNRRVEEKREN